MHALAFCSFKNILFKILDYVKTIILYNFILKEYFGRKLLLHRWDSVKVECHFLNNYSKCVSTSDSFVYLLSRKFTFLKQLIYL